MTTLRNRRLAPPPGARAVTLIQAQQAITYHRHEARRDGFSLGFAAGGFTALLVVWLLGLVVP